MGANHAESTKRLGTLLYVAYTTTLVDEAVNDSGSRRCSCSLAN